MPKRSRTGESIVDLGQRESSVTCSQDQTYLAQRDLLGRIIIYSRVRPTRRRVRTLLAHRNAHGPNIFPAKLRRQPRWPVGHWPAFACATVLREESGKGLPFWHCAMQA